LPRALTDVADPQVPRRAVEGGAPRVPQPIRPDLGARARSADERVVRRDRVRTARFGRRTDPEHLAQKRRQGLTVPMRIATAATVPETDVQVAVRPEEQVAAV